MPADFDFDLESDLSKFDVACFPRLTAIKMAEIKAMVIPRNDQYVTAEQALFQFTSNPGGLVISNHPGTVIIRDVFIELKRNTVPVLRELARAIGIPQAYKMKKQELILAITPRLIFE